MSLLSLVFAILLGVPLCTGDGGPSCATDGVCCFTWDGSNQGPYSGVSQEVQFPAQIQVPQGDNILDKIALMRLVVDGVTVGNFGQDNCSNCGTVPPNNYRLISDPYAFSTPGKHTRGVFYQGNSQTIQCGLNYTHYVGSDCSKFAYPTFFNKQAIKTTYYDFNGNGQTGGNCDQTPQGTNYFPTNVCYGAPTNNDGIYGAIIYSDCTSQANYSFVYYTDCNCTTAAKGYTENRALGCQEYTGSGKSLDCAVAPPDLCATCVKALHRCKCPPGLSTGMQLCGNPLPGYQADNFLQLNWDGPSPLAAVWLGGSHPIQNFAYLGWIISRLTSCPNPLTTFANAFKAGFGQVGGITTNRITSLACHQQGNKINVTFTVYPDIKVALPHPVLAMYRVGQELGNPSGSFPLWTSFINTYKVKGVDNDRKLEPGQVPTLLLELCAGATGVTWKTPGKCPAAALNPQRKARIQISANPSTTRAQLWTLSVKVLPPTNNPSPSPLPVGYVNVFDTDGTYLANGTITTAVVQFSFTHQFPTGVHNITAVYYGSPTYIRSQVFYTRPVCSTLPISCPSGEHALCCTNKHWSCKPSATPSC